MSNKIIFIGEGKYFNKLIKERTVKQVQADCCVITNENNNALIRLCKKKEIPVHEYSYLNKDEGIRLFAESDYAINFNSLFIYKRIHIDSIKKAIVNIHPGSLPQYAGLFTYQWAIMNGERESAVTLHYVVEGLDKGDIISEFKQEIDHKMTGFQLYDRLMNKGMILIQSFLEALEAGEEPESRSQNLEDYKVYRRKDLPSGIIEVGMKGIDVYNQIRATDYFPFSSPSFSSRVRLDGISYILGPLIGDIYQCLSERSIVVMVEKCEDTVVLTTEDEHEIQVRVLGVDDESESCR